MITYINNLELEGELDRDRELEINIAAGSDNAYLSEEAALQLIQHLIKVFHVPESNIEVIHFPAGINRAECLRAAADRLDVLGDSHEASCPPIIDFGDGELTGE